MASKFPTHSDTDNQFNDETFPQVLVTKNVVVEAPLVGNVLNGIKLYFPQNTRTLLRRSKHQIFMPLFQEFVRVRTRVCPKVHSLALTLTSGDIRIRIRIRQILGPTIRIRQIVKKSYPATP